MVWFFQREADNLRLEVRFDRKTLVYSIVLRESSGSVTCINALSEVACRHSLHSMELELEDAGWRKSSSPVLSSEIEHAAFDGRDE